MMKDNFDADKNKVVQRPQRPWDLLQKQKIEDFIDDSILDKNNEYTRPDRTSKSAINQLVALIQSNQRLMLFTFAAAILILGGYASTIPSTFYSTLHLYAPEKSDSIGTRLSLFTQRLEYASFPVDYKTPISLVSRRLREDTAKNWVIEKIKANATDGEKISENAVSVETNYVPNQEILAIEGYANTPELASRATQYYWDFLNEDIHAIEVEQQNKIRRWFDLTNQSLNEQIDAVIKQIEVLSPKTFERNGVAKIQESLGEVFSTLELSLTSLQKQLNNLKSLQARSEYVGITESLDPEVGSQLKIYNQLLQQKNVISDERVNDEKLRITEVINRRVKEITFEIQNISSGQMSAESQMVHMNSKENRIKVATEQDLDLRTQLMTLRSQKSDLLKFKSQIEMEASIRSPSFKPIRMPTPNPSSIRPLPAVKYGMVFVIALFMSLIVVISNHFLFSKSKNGAIG